VGRGRSKFCGALSLYNIWGLLYEKEYKITNIKLGMKVNIYFGPLPEPWKGPV
jgi:hypothetical protein